MFSWLHLKFFQKCHNLHFNGNVELDSNALVWQKTMIWVSEVFCEFQLKLINFSSKLFSHIFNDSLKLEWINNFDCHFLWNQRTSAKSHNPQIIKDKFSATQLQHNFCQKSKLAIVSTNFNLVSLLVNSLHSIEYRGRIQTHNLSQTRKILAHGSLPSKLKIKHKSEIPSCKHLFERY